MASAIIGITLVILICMDFWRFLAHHYIICLAICLNFNDLYIHASIIFGSLYLWSGIFKFNNAFRGSVFTNVYWKIDESLSAVFHDGFRLKMKILLSWAGPFLEICIGIVLLTFNHINFLKRQILYATSLAILALHLFILLFIGFVGTKSRNATTSKPRYYIITWNITCCAISIMILKAIMAMHEQRNGLQDNTLLRRPVHFSDNNWLVSSSLILLFLLYPLSLLSSDYQRIIALPLLTGLTDSKESVKTGLSSD